MKRKIPAYKSAVICSIIYMICLFLIPGKGEADDFMVKRILIEGLHSCSNEELITLMGLHPGTLSRDLISRGIKRAFRKGLFDDLIVKFDTGILTVDVKERVFIDDVTVKGNSYLSDSEIKARLPFRVNDIVRYDQIELARKQLKEYYRLRGFPSAEVDVIFKKGGKKNRVHIVVEISEGTPERIQAIEIKGYSRWIRTSMSLDVGDIYDQERVRKELRRLTSYLKSKGFFNPSVGPYTYRDGVLTISISTGKRLKVDFVGNDHISRSRLMEVLPFDGAEAIGTDLVEEASANIISTYHREGFPFAQVAPVLKEAGKTIDLTFFIYEGKRYEIGTISFKGLSMPAKKIKEALALKEGDVFNPDALDSDKERLIELYRALGFLDARVVDTDVKFDEDKGLVNIALTVREGERSLIGKIILRGNTVFNDGQIKRIMQINVGDPYNTVDIVDAKRRVVNFYKEHGYLQVRIEITSEREGESVTLNLNILEGKRAYFGKTIIKGNFVTRSIVVMRELNYKEGDPLNFTLLPELSKRLYQTGLFRDINISLIKGEDDRFDVLIDLEEARPGIFEFGFGYGEYEKLRGFMSISYRNLWGMNRRLNLRAELSALKQRYTLGYREPYLYLRGSPLRFNAFIQGEYRKEKNIDTGKLRYIVRKYSAEASIVRNLSKRLKGELSYNYSIVKTFDISPDVVLSREDTGTLAISSITPGILYDQRDNPFDPHNGFLLGSSLKVASSYLLGETDFVKLNLQGSFFRTVYKGVVLALSLKGGFAQGYGDTRELPVVERYFLGGRNSVRGFPQDELGPKGTDGTPTGGNAFLLTNIELRTSLGKGIGLVFFFDSGNVWRTIDDIDLSMRYTAGLGLRYSTPIGPIRIDYGYKLDRREGESSGEIHFSIGQAF
ncbi:MAG TPA: outer membrane protein assembly factor BamA [Nitrospirae bacterium]|nr:outer membrane protein assembly factor BamA [Nitrospirota bacterium]